MNHKTIRTLLGECYFNVTKALHTSVMCYVLATLLCFITTYVASGSTSTLSSVQDSVPKKGTLKVLLAEVRCDSLDKLIPIGMAETASALAFASSDVFELVTPEALDSLAETLPQPLSISRALQILKADVGAYVTINRLHNLLRAEVVLQDTTERRGVGYAVIRLVNDSAKKGVPDPAILLAVQRALMASLKNPLLYANADSLVQAVPASLVVVGGIVFQPTPSNLPPWSLYKEKVTASYDGIQTIIATLHNQKDVAMIDAETRDTMMAKAGLYLVENYNAITPKETMLYYAFGLTHIITGSISRVIGGADVTLTYNSIEKDKLIPIRSRTTRVKLDSKIEFRNGIAECTKLLFDIKE